MRSSSSTSGRSSTSEMPGGEEEVDLLVGEAGRGEERAERLPVGGLLADLLGELALGGLQRVLALLVELAGGDLEQVGDADRLARLADEPELVAVEHDDADRAGVVDELADSTSAPSSWRNVPRSTLKNLPSKIVSVRDAFEAWSSCRRGLLEQGEADVEHRLERGDGDALGRLVVVLGAVGDVDARDAGGLEDVRVRRAAGGDALAARSRARAARASAATTAGEDGLAGGSRRPASR